MRRRDFLKQTAIAAATLSLSPLRSFAFDPGNLERQGAAKRVIIVGAGLAGLSAAYELTQAGHDVTVLEARTRPGGRVHTLRDPFPEGLHAEAGATRVPDNHHFTLRYAELFGLTLDPFEPADVPSVSGACGIERCSPQSAPFPPQPPPRVALPCSAGSSVLRHSPTSPVRSRPPFGLWPSRTGLDRLTKTCRTSPGSRACCFSACAGS